MGEKGGQLAPAVSVLLTAYRDTYLGQAIVSVLDQTYRDFELLVLDDSRTDDILRVIATVCDERVRVFPSQQLGVAANHNRGLHAARGDRIAIINHDDVWFPTLLQELVNALDAHPHAVVAFADHWVIDASGVPDEDRSRRNSEHWGRAGLSPGFHRPFRPLAIEKRGIPIAQCAVWKRGLVDSIPVWAGDRYDYWLQVHLARTGCGAVYVPKQLASFREHEDNLSSTAGLRRRLEGERFFRLLLKEGGLGESRGCVRRCHVESIVHLAKWPGWVIAEVARSVFRQGGRRL